MIAARVWLWTARSKIIFATWIMILIRPPLTNDVFRVKIENVVSWTVIKYTLRLFLDYFRHYIPFCEESRYSSDVAEYAPVMKRESMSCRIFIFCSCIFENVYQLCVIADFCLMIWSGTTYEVPSIDMKCAITHYYKNLIVIEYPIVLYLLSLIKIYCMKIPNARRPSSARWMS